jgi:hypothetical protein
MFCAVHSRRRRGGGNAPFGHEIAADSRSNFLAPSPSLCLKIFFPSVSLSSPLPRTFGVLRLGDIERGRNSMPEVVEKEEGRRCWDW